jgi:hypothetical protein
MGLRHGRRRSLGAWSAFALCLAVALGLLASAAAQRAHADQAQQAVQSSVNGDRIQRDAPLPERTRQSIDEAESEPDIQRNPPVNQPLNLAFPHFHLNLGWLPYVILGLIAVGLLVMIGRYLQGRAGLNPADKDAKPQAPGTTSYAIGGPETERDHTFDEVDALAAAGDFTEAVHRLLLLVQERLRGRIEHGIQVSLTSREILRRAKLPTDGATAFGTLVAAVEVSLFGMQAANAATYERCKENCRRVLAAATGVTA